MKKSQLIIIFLVMILSIVIRPLEVGALPGGVELYTGYFNGKTIGSDTGIDPILSSHTCGTPLTADMFNGDQAHDKVAFINRIMDFYGGGCASEQSPMGATFIMQAMLNTRGSNANVDGWKNYINSSNITLRWSNAEFFDYTSGCFASGGCNDDESRDEYFVNRPGSNGGTLVFYDSSLSSIVFKIQGTCGNAISEITNWSITPSVSADKSTVSPGEQVTWTHTIKNNGPTQTTKDVNYYYQESDSSGNLIGSRVELTPSMTNGANIDETRSSTSTSSAPSSGTICRVTIAEPSGSNSSTAIISSPACVTVNSTEPPSSGVCRPMTISVSTHNTQQSSHSAARTPVPVRVYTTDANGKVREVGVFSSSTTVNVTSTYTTGDIYTVHYEDSPSRWISSWRNEPKRYLKYVDKITGQKHYGYRDNWIATYSYRTSWGGSTIGPCFDYAVTSLTKSNSNYRVEVDSIVNITPSISYKSFTGRYTTKSKQSNWVVNQITFKPSVSVPVVAAVSNSIDPCSYYKGKGADTCAQVPSKSGNVVFNSSGGTLSGSSPSSQFPVTIGDYPSGTKVCYVLSVHPAASDPSNNSFSADNTWAHSALDGQSTSANCAIVVKKPKVQVWGGDLFAGLSPLTPSVLTMTSVKNVYGSTRTFGSWAEYAIFATGSVTGMGSGAAFSGSLGLNGNTSACSYSTLSFSNAVGGGSCTGTSSIGSYKNFNEIPNVAADFPITSSTNTFNGGDISGLKGIYKTNGNITITGGNPIRKSQWIVINAPNSNVTITGNIKYTTENIANINEIPQVVIIARNIYISSSVTSIDAWLIAPVPSGGTSDSNGSINTCIEAGTSNRLTVNICNQLLTITGPVMANHLYLRRTAGSGTGSNSNDPSEIFNLRSDAFLWAYSRATSSGRVQTVYTTEVPPRL